MYKHGASKSKKNKNAKIAKASELLAQEYGVDVVWVKYRHWYYSWWLFLYFGFLLFPLWMAWDFKKKHERQTQEVIELYKKGYKPVDETMTRTIVVQMMGLPWEGVSSKLVKQINGGELRHKFKLYKKGKLDNAQAKMFEKNFKKFQEENPLLSQGKKFKKVEKTIQQKKGSK